MHRLSFILLPLLVLTALAPVAPLVEQAAAATTGAAFTTVDRAVDGTGHCANGNPGVNCNIYNGKQFVWLNGGPKASKLGPNGLYFFAVLAPGGQPAANDGTPKNLSDDFDAYTNRTFTVTGGKVSAYSGTHWFDSGSHALGPADNRPPFIRLAPYANTPNPGGVYTLAICSLAHGYPVRAKDCKYDAFKVKAAVVNTPTNTGTVSVTPSATATGSKTATATATATHTATPTDTNTPTATFTFTPTITNTVCAPQTETGNLGSITLGGSVEGLGVVAPDLNINAENTAVKIMAGVDPLAYYGNGPSGPVKNGGVGPGGAFTDFKAHLNKQAHHYTFTFTPGVTVSDFWLHMLDSGDWNPTLATSHYVLMRAFNASDGVIAQRSISYTTPPEVRPTTSSIYGDLNITGDAMTAKAGQPGNWTWHITGTGIVKIRLDFGVGYDPNLALNGVKFTTECP